MNRQYIRSLIPAALLSVFLVGCGSDKDNNFLDSIPEVVRLTASPQVFVLKQGDTQHVDLTQSVTAQNIASWSLTQLDDKSGLGDIIARQTTAFDYQ